MEGPNPEWFINPANQDIFQSLMTGAAIEDLEESELGELSEAVGRVLGAYIPESSDDELVRGLRECVSRMESRRLKRLKQAEESALGDEEALGDAVEAIRGRALAINEGLKKIHTRGTAV